MRLSQLIDTGIDAEVTGITADSRLVKKGNVFAALPGSKANGNQFIADAVMHGARVVVAEEGAVLPEGAEAQLLIVKNARLALAQMASKYYARQPQVIAAVTGTSGKTSTVNFTQQLWEMSGISQSASIGTLGVRGAGLIRSGSLTTPDTVSLHAELSDLASVGISHLAMEASSHGLDQYRLDGVRISIAAYTNLSRDHLDYHADMDEYFAAKMRLFAHVMQHGIAVLNADDDYFEKVSAICAKAGHRTVTFGEDGTDIKILSRTAEPMGQRLNLFVYGKSYDIVLPLVGKFQVLNALCALGIVLAEDGEADLVVPLLSKLQGVPGRLQLVSGHPHNAAVYVDYAHKPAALEAVLTTLRPHTKGRLVCLVGCGGDRDAGKRPVMGRIAAGLSDLVIITDDNPRSENPADIRAAMMEGAPDAQEIGDRRKAIEYAMEELEEGDVLVIAGKGHEQGQIIGDRVEPFDDVKVAKETIEKLKGKL